MNHQPTPQLNAFRSIVQQAGTLHAELSTLDTAIRDLDSIKTRMGDSRDESEVRKLLSELTRAEETVTVKRFREPRLRADLADTVTQAEHAFQTAFTEVESILTALAESSVQAFRDLLQFIQPDQDNPKTLKANEVTQAAVGPAALTQRLRNDLDNAWRAVGVVSGDPYQGVKGVNSALAIMDEVLATVPQVHAATQRMSAACEAFRKVFTKG